MKYTEWFRPGKETEIRGSLEINKDSNDNEKVSEYIKRGF